MTESPATLKILIMKLDAALIKSMEIVGLTDSENVVRESVALFLFQKKLVSVGKAASLADMSLARFIELLKSLKIPQTEYTSDDLSMDFKTLHKLERKK